MIESLKPEHVSDLMQHRWSPEHGFRTVPHHGQLPPPGTYIALLNTFSNKWEFGYTVGIDRQIQRVWISSQLPAEFRTGLLLVGVPT